MLYVAGFNLKRALLYLVSLISYRNTLPPLSVQSIFSSPPSFSNISKFIRSMIKNECVPTGEQDDLHADAGNVEVKIEMMEVGNPSCGFEAMEEDHQRGVVMETVGEKDLWLDRDQENFLDVNEDSIFYGDFPPLPDFPCMSSSSSSSSVSPAVNPVAATSSSSRASSSPTAEEDTGQRNFQQIKGGDQVKASMEITPPSEYVGVGNVDCNDVMETFGYMDLLDSNDIWDPFSVFQSENPQEFMEDQQAAAMVPPSQDQKMLSEEENDDGLSFIQGNSELAMLFFKWLKQNKDYISAEDMRNIKLKRSTIECASKRLGSTKEGKKQLLKLILEWVEQFQLQKNRTRESGQQYTFPSQETAQNPEFNPNSYSYSNMNYNPPYPHPTTCFPTNPWMPVAGAATMGAQLPAFSPPMERYSGGDPCINYNHAAPLNYQVANGIPYLASAEYSSMEHAQSWAPMAPFTMPPPSQFSPFPDNGNLFPQHYNLYGNPYLLFDKNGERLVKLGSLATKEARKKRMARQRSLYSYHNRRNSNPNQNHDQINDQNVVADECENGSQERPTEDCMYWSSVASSANSSMVTTVPPVDVSQQPNYPRHGTSDRRQQQGWKTEKNLKFLLQKVLKQSDVGNLGRIVLPKKEAESHLPELGSRDGIPIAMEDIGTSRVWNMRYRFWPNNKSRMYLLENTGEFVRMNGLQEGDFIVIYSDMKCGKYMIRGVKVRQPGTKLEGKKLATRKNARGLSISRTTLAPLKQSV